VNPSRIEAGRHDENADEAGGDGEPADEPDPLAERRSRQRRDDEGHREVDRHHVGERHGCEGECEGHEADEQNAAAEQHERQVPRWYR
jgi:hypothetical protein